LSYLDGSIAIGIAGCAAALCLLAAALAIRPGEFNFLKSFIGPYLVAGAVIPAWMIIQLLPLPWLAHPVWKTAAEALGQPITGHISIDLGDTLSALLLYLTGFSVALAATAVAIDRRRARWIANTTIVATTGLAILWAAAVYFSLPVLLSSTAGAVLMGVPVCQATALEAFELRIVPSAASDRSFLRPVVCFIAAAVACALAWASSGTIAAFVIAIETGALLTIWISRRLRLPLWGKASVAATICAIGMAVAAPSSHDQTVPLAIAFSSAPADQIAATQTMLSDLPWSGVGAGAAKALLPTYTELQEGPSPVTIASAAAEALTGLGPIFFWMALSAAGVGMAVLAVGALNRGRDWSFPASAASGLFGLAAASFALPAVFTLPTVILTSAILGMGLAQRASRTRA
jgi:hypothetical protein